MTTKPFAKDPDVISLKLKALVARQPIGDLYVATINHKLIQKITYFDVRRVLQEKRDVERYLGIQRPLSAARVEDLKAYVNYIDATFPTSIILAVESDFAAYDEKRGELTLSNTRKGNRKPGTAIRNLCRVIDGQHRIAGLSGYKGENFDLLVTIFVGSDVADQAYVFATVNLEQTKVNKSLAIDLFDLARSRSPIKTCHNIAVALDQTKSSPFYHRIKRLGVATEGRANDNETITQATFVGSLLPYITADAEYDRDLVLRGEKLQPVLGSEARKFPLRNLFITERDVMIGRVIEQYFLAVQKRWPEAWDYRGTGIMLNRTNGFRALMRLFGRMYNHLAAPGDFVDMKKFMELFRRVNVSWKHFSVKQYKPGTSGEADLKRFLEDSIFSD